LASAGKDQTVRFWNAVPRIPRLRFDDVIQAPAFSPDDRWIALRRRDQGIHVLDLESGQTVQVFDAAELGGFSADGRSLSLLVNDATFERRSMEDGRLLGSFAIRTPTGKYTRRLLTGDGCWLVVGHDDGGITVEAVGSDIAVRHLDGHRMMIVSLDVSPDGTRLLSGCLDRTARLWDLRTGELLHTFEGHRMAVASGAFSADGKVMATGSWDDTARVWDVESRRELALLGGHSASVHDVALAPDGRTLAVLSGGGVLKFWSLAAGREAGVLRFDQGRGLGSLGFSPGGRWLAVVTSSGGLTLLEAPREPVRIVR
jgi:hypothetical protein